MMRLSIRSWVTEWKGLPLLLLALKQSRTVVSGPRCQDTILGDVDAQTRFETTSKQSNDPPLSKVNTFGSREDKIIDFLKASSVNYALTVNPVIYTSCIQQFWATAQVKTVNDVRQIQALIDKKKLIITETSTRSDLYLDDAKYYPTNSTQIPIIDQPSTSSQPKKKQKSRRKQRKEAGVANDEIKQEDSIPIPSNDPLRSGEDSMCNTPKLGRSGIRDRKTFPVIMQQMQTSQNGLRRLKKGRRIEDIDADVEVTIVNKTQERHDEDLMFDTGVLDGYEMFVDAITGEKDEQSTKIDDSTAGDEGVTAAKIDELTLAQTLIEIKEAKPKVVITAATTTTTTRPKARGVVVQEPSEFRTSLEAQPSKKEERLERQKQEEANIALIESWENTQAMIEADRLLAERLQTREREELTDEEKGKLFMELMQKRRKHFATLRAQEKRNKRPTKAQKRSQMSTYLKHMETQETNEKKVEGSEEKAKSSRKKSLGKKRAVREQQLESPKRQKLGDDKETDEHEEVEADDTAELKKHLVIKKDDDIAIDVIPLATKPPVIVDYKLLKEGIMVHYQLIRADGSSKRHSSMIRLLQGIDREDLQTL
ncbi:hypothetical protein Tco_0628946 [Tanacetum coccineum]|uniref:Uncharacterized protein n=1 Tax=Tanacetum coccineum TaxID=301880 RepID=A0ABQ4WRQ5_9ASTR